MKQRSGFAVAFEAYREFRKLSSWGAEVVMAANIALGIVHLHLAEQYRARHLHHPLSKWHFWKAGYLANRAIELRKLEPGGRDGVHPKFRREEAEVVAEILERTPYGLFSGGNSCIANNIRRHAGNGKNGKILPSERAKVLITLGRGYQCVGEMDRAKFFYHLAHGLVKEMEGKDVAEVLQRLGFSYFDSADPEDRRYGETLVAQALDIARERFPELHTEIEQEWMRRRGFRA